MLYELHADQLALMLEWGQEPWEGVSPRYLTRGSCVVDNCEIGCPSREAHRFGVDPAQYQLCVSTSFKKEVDMESFTREPRKVVVVDPTPKS